MIDRRTRIRKGGFFSLALLVLVLPACGGAGGGVAVTTSLGIATLSAAMDETQTVLRNEGYRIERADGPPNIIIRTEWRHRSAMPSEEELGVREARTRFIIEGRQRGGDIQQIALFNMRMRVENEGRSGSGEDYTSLDATEDFTDYVNAIAREMRDRYETGIRME